MYLINRLYLMAFKPVFFVRKNSEGLSLKKMDLRTNSSRGEFLKRKVRRQLGARHELT
jgi:hypothetical protein